MPNPSGQSGRVDSALCSRGTTLAVKPSEPVRTRPGRLRILTVPPVPSLLETDGDGFFESGRSNEQGVVE